MLADIYEAQRRLNHRTVGFDVCSIQDEAERLLWFRNYLTAWDQELKELMESLDRDQIARGETAPDFRLDVRNARVEVVDMLHFLMSMLQVLGEEGFEHPSLPPDLGDLLDGLAGKHAERHGLPMPPDPDEEAMNRLLLLHCCHAAVETGVLLDHVQWKWWAKQENRWDEARIRLYTTILPRWCLLVLATGMDAGTVVDLYMKKNKLNFERQDGGYREGTYEKKDAEGREDNVKLFED